MPLPLSSVGILMLLVRLYMWSFFRQSIAPFDVVWSRSGYRLPQLTACFFSVRFQADDLLLSSAVVALEASHFFLKVGLKRSRIMY